MNAVRLGKFENVHTLIVADHASAQLPEGVDLGLTGELMRAHIASDIGVLGIAEKLVQQPGFAAIHAEWSRLLVDTNRCPTDAAAIPERSDGIDIAGNRLDETARSARFAQYHAPFHDDVSAAIDEAAPVLLLFLHSFTPQLAGDETDRPWHVGLLYNEDRRGADIAMDFFRQLGFCVGDQQPYSGLIYNYSFVRHAEARGLPHILLEIRQDLIADKAGQAKFAELVAELSRKIVETLA